MRFWTHEADTVSIIDACPMPKLEFKLLGSPQILLDGQPLVLQPRNSVKAKAILYYLAASGLPQSRERLAGLLWSDWPERKARDYLRGEIHLLNPLKEVAYVEAEGRLVVGRRYMHG